jgi:hypothetical protein
MADALGMVTPFIGIIISVLLFRKLNPDTVLSKLNIKKSFKV